MYLRCTKNWGWWLRAQKQTSNVRTRLYSTSYQGTDEARSSCVTLLLLKSFVLNFHQEKINAPRLKDLMAEDVLYGRERDGVSLLGL